jgi:hypothetical protein
MNSAGVDGLLLVLALARVRRCRAVRYCASRVATAAAAAPAPAGARSGRCRGGGRRRSVDGVVDHIVRVLQRQPHDTRVRDRGWSETAVKPLPARFLHCV